MADCITDLSEHNVKIKLLRSKSVLIKEENIKVNGYWDDSAKEGPTLVCAVRKPLDKWVPIFIHEYCHFLQWKEKTPLWKENQDITAHDMELIIHNKPIDEETLTHSLNVARELELDCEKRVVKLLKKYKIPVSVEAYIQKANVYVHFYNYIKQFRQWYKTDNIPYNNKRIISAASTEFYSSYDEIPEKLFKAYRKHYPVHHKSNLK
jgi:hypothetical protein